MTESQIPPEALERAQGRPVKGYTADGKINVVLESITSVEDLQATIREEVFHTGLPTLLGNEYTTDLDNLYNARGIDGMIALAQAAGDTSFTTRYQAVIAEVQSNPRNKDARRELVEEALARVIENPKMDQGLIPLIKRIYARLRRFYKKMGGNVELISNADLFLLARDAYKAGLSPAELVSRPEIRFRFANDNDGVLTNSPDGTLQVTDAFGTRDASTFRGRTAVELQDKQTVISEWFNGKLAGKHGVARDTFVNSDLWNSMQQKVTQVHAPLIQHGRNIAKEAANFSESVLGTVRANANYLEDKPVLAKTLQGLFNPVDARQMLQPDSFVVLQKSVALNRYNNQSVTSDGKTLRQLEDEVALALRALRDQTKESEEKTLRAANRYTIARHAKDRNRVLWYLKGARKKVGKENKKLHRELTNRIRAGDPSAWSELVSLVDANVARDPEYTAAGMTDAQADTYIAAVEADPTTAPHYQAIFDTVHSLVEGTNNMDRQTGKLSQSVENVIKAYGWQDTYVPLIGQDEDGDATLRGLYGSALDDSFRSVEGRDSTADALGAVFRKAQKAAEYSAGQEVARSVMVNVAAHTTSSEFASADRKALFQGSIKEYDLNGPEYKKLLRQKVKNRIIYFDPDNTEGGDQRAVVINLTNEAGVTAIKGTRSETADKVEGVLRKARIPQATSFISSLLTYRNLPFIPFDAIRTTLTYAYNIGTDEDFGAVQDFTRNLMASDYMPTIGRFSRLLATRDFAGIDALAAKEGPNSIAAQLKEFIELGGRNEFTQSIQLDPLENAPGVRSAAGAIGRGLDNFDQFFQTLNNATDLMGRFAFYQTKVQRGLDKKTAAARAVNLANFGARGTWSGPLGGIFAFFRATSSGAFGQANQLLNGENTGPFLGVAAGAGIMLYYLAYAFSDTDDEGNNRVAEMDGKRFIKDFSFRMGGEDLRFGIGFGGGANALGVGFQLARFSLGHQSLQNTADNIVSSIKDTSAVVPLSGIGVTQDPVNFVLDSITPSLAKPIMQTLTNTNGLGFDVYTGEADNPYDGRLSTKGSLAERMAIGASNTGIVDVNPDILELFGRSWLGTIWTLLNAIDENFSNTTDAGHLFNFRRGAYGLNQFFGPETFTQIASDYYNKVDFALDREQRIKDLRRVGLDESADALENDEEYQEVLPLAQRARDEVSDVNKDYRDTLNDVTALPAGQRRNSYADAQVEKRSIMRDYLDQADVLGQIRVR